MTSLLRVARCVSATAAALTRARGSSLHARAPLMFQEAAVAAPAIDWRESSEEPPPPDDSRHFVALICRSIGREHDVARKRASSVVVAF